MNRAITVAELNGPAAGLGALADLEDGLDGYHLFHAARADLLGRLDRAGEAVAAYDRAIQLAGNETEQTLFAERRGQLLYPDWANAGRRNDADK